MSQPHASKSALRRELRGRRAALSPGAQRAAALALPRAIAALPGWEGAARIALYLSADGEIDTGPLATRGRLLDKQLFLPVLDAGERLVFAAWHEEDTLCANRYRIPEPPATAARCAAAALDIVFLPLVGWDRYGGRLGMGGGFYDRTLAGVTGPLRIGLGHDCQQLDRVPREAWDIPLDYVATGSRLLDCRTGQALAVTGAVSPE